MRNGPIIVNTSKDKYAMCKHKITYSVIKQYVNASSKVVAFVLPKQKLQNWINNTFIKTLHDIIKTNPAITYQIKSQHGKIYAIDVQNSNVNVAKSWYFRHTSFIFAEYETVLNSLKGRWIDETILFNFSEVKHDKLEEFVKCYFPVMFSGLNPHVFILGSLIDNCKIFNELYHSNKNILQK